MEWSDAFRAPGRWYKGNTHLHTTGSDGTLSPDEVCALYRGAGYDFLALTDHNRITLPDRAPEGLLLIPSAELNNGLVHVVGLNIRKESDSGESSPQELIDRINRDGGVAIVAHPYWSGLAMRDLHELRGYACIEVYNNVCQCLRGKGYSSVHWDDLLQEGRKVWGVAADDAHNLDPKRFDRDVLGSFVMVKAPSLDAASIAASIRRGEFYSSTGVEIRDLRIEGNKLVVETSPAAFIDFIGFNASGLRISGLGKEIQRAELPIENGARYLRVEITNRQNQKAWTNPLIL